MIKQKLQAEQIIALKAGEKEKLTTLRYILAQIKNKEIDKMADLSEEEEISVMRKIAKELKESIEAFQKGARNDLVAQSQTQLDLVNAYLPQEISDEELKKEIEKIISLNQEVYNKNQKAIIGIAVKKLKTKAEPARIIQILQTLNV